MWTETHWKITSIMKPHLVMQGKIFSSQVSCTTPQNSVVTRYEYLLRTVVMRNQEMNSVLLNLEVV